MNIENLIVDTITKDVTFSRRTISYITPDLFESDVNSKIFTVVKSYYSRYQKPINRTTLLALFDGLKIEENIHKHCVKKINDCFNNKDTVDTVWLTEETDTWIKKRAVFNGVMKAIEKIQNGKNISDLPEIFKDALTQGFNQDIGFDIFEEAETAYEMINQKTEKLPFSIPKLNELTGGGNEKKAITIIAAAVNVGKSMMMCSLASDDIRQGKNVVYFSGEMSEYKIAQRIYANLFNTPIGKLGDFHKEEFSKRASIIHKKYNGNLVVKEFPTGSADTHDLRNFLQELLQKKGIVPDVIYVDYLNLFNSVRFGKESNSYTQFKAVTEELRGMAVEWNIPVITATQLNKEGSRSENPDMTDVAESYGVMMTADLSITIVETDTLKQRGLLKIDIIKNRFAENKESFLVKVDKPRMKIEGV